MTSLIDAPAGATSATSLRGAVQVSLCSSHTSVAPPLDMPALPLGCPAAPASSFVALDGSTVRELAPQLAVALSTQSAQTDVTMGRILRDKMLLLPAR
jgi:hypothetical protein